MDEDGSVVPNEQEVIKEKEEKKQPSLTLLWMTVTQSR
jgi:hypothetical protein